MHTIDYVRKVQACTGFLVILMPLTGCASGKISFLNPVDDFITDTDYDTISSSIDNPHNYVDYKSWRNNYISMKMFYIDKKKYTQYIHDIAHEDTFIGLFGDITQLGLTAAATAIPVTQTTKVLAAAATAVGAAKAVYNKDVLLAQRELSG